MNIEELVANHPLHGLLSEVVYLARDEWEYVYEIIQEQENDFDFNKPEDFTECLKYFIEDKIDDLVDDKEITKKQAKEFLKQLNKK